MLMDCRVSAVAGEPPGTTATNTRKRKQCQVKTYEHMHKYTGLRIRAGRGSVFICFSIPLSDSPLSDSISTLSPYRFSASEA